MCTVTKAGKKEEFEEEEESLYDWLAAASGDDRRELELSGCCVNLFLSVAAAAALVPLDCLSHCY